MNTDIIFQGPNGEIILKDDTSKETIWASLDQIANLFGRNKSTISRHIKNIYLTGELESHQTVAKIATVQVEGKKSVKRDIEHYNLDMILSIGYRVDSKQATQFRKWSTKILSEHITQGYSIDKMRVSHNYDQFISVVEDIKKLLPENKKIANSDILELVKSYASTWLSLDSYDKDTLPNTGLTQSSIVFSGDELMKRIGELKSELISKGEASELFAQEKNKNSLQGILGNIFASFDGADLYPTLEEKSAHLLYFIIKNHPFIDGNKRSGAYSFIWFLRASGYNFREKITPEALTVITLLVAESKPQEKQRIIGLILLLLQ